MSTITISHLQEDGSLTTFSYTETAQYKKYSTRLFIRARVYNKEGGRVSYSSIVPCTAVIRVQARLMIFTMCGVIYGVIVGSRSRIRVACLRNALAKLCKL